MKHAGAMLSADLNVDTLLKVSDRIAHTAIAKANQLDGIYRQQIGSDAPSFHTPEIQDALKRLNFQEPAPGKTQFGKVGEQPAQEQPRDKSGRRPLSAFDGSQ
jgi:hypothetical protein